MPTPKGSPRTSLVSGSLKENIGKLRRCSVALQEVDESLLSPVGSKSPLSPKVVKASLSPKDQRPLSSGKRKSSEQLTSVSKKKRVSFGPMLSPEQFDKSLPPKTPVKRGATPCRQSASGPKSCLPGSVKKRHSIAAIPLTERIEEESPFKKSPSKRTKQNTPSPRGRTSSPKASPQKTPSPRGRTPSPKASSPPQKTPSPRGRTPQKTPSPRGRTPSPRASSPQKLPSPRGRTPSPKASSPPQKTPSTTNSKSRKRSPNPKSPKVSLPSLKSTSKKTPISDLEESPVSSCKNGTPQSSRRSLTRISPEKVDTLEFVEVTPEVNNLRLYFITFNLVTWEDGLVRWPIEVLLLFF